MGVTLKDIAEKAGVSITTVSRVINGDQESPVSEDTREQVWKFVKELGYIKSGSSRNLRRNTKKIGYVFNQTPNIYNHPYFSVILEAIETEIKARGFTIGFSLCEADVRQQSVRHQMMSENVDGLIYVSDYIDDELLAELKKNFANIVFIDTIRDDLEKDLIYVDRMQAGYKATRHLIDLGHQRIGFIGGAYQEAFAPPFYQEKRLQGYMKAMKEADLEIDKDIICNGDWEMEPSYKVMKKLIKRGNLPTAIFTASDLMAIGTMRAIHEAGLVIPDDISLISYDDIEMAQFTNPPLTTIHVPKIGIGKLAVKILMEQIYQDWELPFPVKAIVPTKISLRQSTAHLK